ncbi:Nmad5 family putative nucleotide modification protein [Acinetobacter baumannii]|uniref:Nmad5 family putative nucleotide modification protein n=1 Tax=Acinetobacter baumannii TaxID=470 RepID=UPI00338E23BC
MSRLTKNLRERMRDCVINKTFDSKFDALNKQKVEVSEKIYLDIYGNHIETMNKLPKGFLKGCSYLYIAIGGQEHCLYFSSDKLKAYNHDRWDKAKLYVGDEPLAVEFMNVVNALEKLEKERDRMRREVFSLLDSVQTFKKLWEVWPESKTLLADFEKKPIVALLPAIQIQKLNDALGLPAGEAI